jgi:ELWxxDGT repeat protein
VNVNGTLFFSAFDFTHGMELWKSDGTVAGTVLVRDIVPGDTSSTPSSLAAFDGALYFRLWSDGSIWKSDGSEAGTVLVHSIASGEQLVPSGDHLFASSGSELWASDGTAAGTALVRDMGVSFSLVGAATVPGALLFWIDGGSDGLELWRSDGTPAGTTLVRTLGPGNAVPLGGGSTSIPGAAVFLAGNTTLGLWRSDGTPAGTYPLTVPRFPPYDSYPMWLADVNGTLLFFASDEAHGSELWRSDGTPEGTRLVKDITPGSGFTGSSPFLVAPSTVYFLTWANNATKKLYRTDGTEAGTVIVKEVPAGPGTATWLGLLGELFLWVFDDGVHGVEPWRSDGTPDGTVLLGDLTPGAVSSQISAVGALNGQFYLAASDGTSTTLWRTDGSTAGTVAIGPIPATSQPGAELDGVIYFPVTDPTHGNELWRTDGTAAGTGLFLDINPSGGSSPSIVGRPGNRLIFWADDGLHGFEPWVTDGTVPGTVLLKDLNPGPAPSGINRPTTVGSTLYFFAYDGAHGRELWRTDGTAAGTILVRDIAPGLSGSYLIEHMTPMGNGVFFTASNHVSGREPWRSDGTEAGTAQIADLVAGAGNSPTPWTMGHSRTASVRSGGRVFFSATDGTTGYELWSFPIPLGFHPVTPCRVADTRDPTGPAAGVPLANAQTLILPVAGRCGIPSTAISVAANVTVVNPTVTGTLSVFAGGPIVSGTTEVPVTADKTRALNAIPLLGTSGSLSFHAALPQGGSTHVVLDVSGYFE